MTSYVVLKREGGQTEIGEDNADGTERVTPVSWVEVGKIEAANDVAAIRAMASGAEGVEGGVDLSNGAVAVPARSWKPRTPTVKREERTLWA